MTHSSLGCVKNPYWISAEHDHDATATGSAALAISSRLGGVRELRFSRGSRQCVRRRRAAADDLRDLVEVAGADFALVAGRGVAVRLAGELALLEVGVGGHAAAAVLVGELEQP